ncbi:MAG: hypothetical protein KDB23_10685 [Planctomycetales bacterium]|nr:hypothetical protein [Planctomycetales bacterium]
MDATAATTLATPFPRDYSSVDLVEVILPKVAYDLVRATFRRGTRGEEVAFIVLRHVLTAPKSVALNTRYHSKLLGNRQRSKLFQLLEQLISMGVIVRNNAYLPSTKNTRGFSRRYSRGPNGATNAGGGVSVAVDVRRYLQRRDVALGELGWDCGDGLDYTDVMVEAHRRVDVSCISKAEVVACAFADTNKQNPEVLVETLWRTLLQFDMGVRNRSKRKDGRVFGPLSFCPTSLRSRFRIDGRPVEDVDVHACYWSILTSWMSRGRDRSLLEDALSNGDGYGLH